MKIFSICFIMLIFISTFARAGEDKYEPNDRWQDANIILLNFQIPYSTYEWFQRHNFYNTDDVDWVKFYAVKDELYTISVQYLSPKCNAMIDIYKSDGETLARRQVNYWGQGEDEEATFACEADGVYYAKISQCNTDIKGCYAEYGEDTDYTLILTIPAGKIGFLECNVIPKDSDAVIATTGAGSLMLWENGYYYLPHISGWWTLKACAKGYEYHKDIFVKGPPEITQVDINLEPLPGYNVTSDLWIRAVIHTMEKGPIEAIWKKGGEDETAGGHRVIWGYFYANPSDVDWGSENNPDVFVKIWFDANGRLDVNFFHVSVPEITVYSDYPFDCGADQEGRTTMEQRYVRHYYMDDEAHSEVKTENGSPPEGHSPPTGNPAGDMTINNLRFGSVINTEEKGPIEAVWRLGGQDDTAGGHQVVWGHFYADPLDVTWGSRENPDLFVKIWFDAGGRVDVNFFHVSVPDIEVYSDFPDDGVYDQKGTTVLDNRYVRHEYWK